MSTFLSLLSLLLFMLVAVLWAGSYFRGDVWHLAPGAVSDVTPAAPMVGIGDTQTWRRQWSVHSGAGRVQVVQRELQESSADKPGHVGMPPGQAVDDLAPMTRTDRFLNALGFGYFRREKQPFSRPPVSGWYWGFLIISVPYWALAVGTGIAPALWMRGWRRRRIRRLRLALGQCPRCGYDLRATSGLCPECGSAQAPEGVVPGRAG